MAMIQFEDFFKISNKCLKFIGIEINQIQSAAMKRYFLFNALTMITVIIAVGIFILQHVDNLTVSGPPLTNFLFTFLITLKTLHLWMRQREVHAVMVSLKTVYDPITFSRNYEKNLTKNNKIQIVFISTTFSEFIFKLISIIPLPFFHSKSVCSVLFFFVPIIQNSVATAEGATSSRIFNFDLFVPFSVEPLAAYIVVYIWQGLVGMVGASFLVFNELHFNTLVLMLSMEFDNLADDFGAFDYKLVDKKAFKKLVGRHNKLLTIAKELNMVYFVPISVTFLLFTLLICFSLLQLFTARHLATIERVTNSIKFVTFLNGALVQIYLLCFYCEKLRSSNENLQMKIVNGNYYEASDWKTVKMMQLVLLRAQKPVQMTALGLFGFRIEMFSDVS
jgi:hypothetical protein